MKIRRRQIALFSFAGIMEAVKTSFLRLSFTYQIRNPIMFVIYISSLLTTVLYVFTIQLPNNEQAWFLGSITACLWFTILFANFAEAYAEGKGRAQAESLRKARRDIKAKKLKSAEERMNYTHVYASELKQGDIVLVEADDFIPGDGQVIDGIASVDESAITGESAPVIRESGGERNAVTGGTCVLSDWIVIEIKANPGESFLDKMIALVEGAKRQKTPNEIALGVYITAMTILFLTVCAALLTFSLYIVEMSNQTEPVSVIFLIALLVCLTPTTIGGLLPAIGIAGMNRLIRTNIIATSCHAVEAAGDVSILLLDKTGTITYGNRQAVALTAARGVKPQELAKASTLASLADDTPEGKSVVMLALNKYGLHLQQPPDASVLPFSAETRMSGIVIGERHILKGAPDVIEARVKKAGGTVPDDIRHQIDIIARQGGTPLLVADDDKILGVLQLKDIIKKGIKARLADLRTMGVKSIMITGDNALTAAAIASEAGVDDFIAEATPEAKLKYIRKMQEDGELIAMVGDGTNDAPALAQSDVAVAMNSGTQAAKEAANMVDLDSNPTKLIEIVEIGKQLLMTRGSLTTFSITNDIAKYLAIIPAAFATTCPYLSSLNIMHLASPQSAILSTIVFNALMIMLLIPLALRGVKYRPVGASRLLRANILVYGLGGLLVPFAGIKAIDMFLQLIGAA